MWTTKPGESPITGDDRPSPAWTTDPPKRPRVIAHRGASRAAQENSLEAFRLARTLGAQMVELDVRRSADDALVIHHDPFVADNRLIRTTPRGELPAYVPTLDQAMAACEGMLVNIEIKNDESESDFDPSEWVAEQVVAFLERSRQQHRVVISSFRIESVDKVRELNPEIATAWLVVGVADPEATVAKLLEHGHRILHPHWRACTPALFAVTAKADVRVNCWTCDDPLKMRELTLLGIDGICTNVPNVFVGVLAELNAER